jgi:hypothetical protein
MGAELYRDDYLVVDDTGVTIRRYYFPLATPKRIEFADIKDVIVEQMTWRTGKGRYWGASDPRFWMPMDWTRGKKDKVLVFDVGSRIRPCVTPDDPDRVVELLRSKVSIS